MNSSPSRPHISVPSWDSLSLEENGITLNIISRTVKRDGPEILLTYREYKLLELFMHNPGRVLTREKIKRAIWERSEVKPKIVDIYVYYLRNKIGRGSTKMIHTVRGVGYRFGN